MSPNSQGIVFWKHESKRLLRRVRKEMKRFFLFCALMLYWNPYVFFPLLLIWKSLLLYSFFYLLNFWEKNSIKKIATETALDVTLPDVYPIPGNATVLPIAGIFQMKTIAIIVPKVSSTAGTESVSPNRKYVTELRTVPTEGMSASAVNKN